MDDYNLHTVELAARYGAGVFVSVLDQVKRGVLLVRFCVWPNFGPVVMPICDVVALTEGPQAHIRQPKRNVVGYVGQTGIVEVLGTAISRRPAPFEHLVIEKTIEGEVWLAILDRARPKIGPAATDALGSV